MAKQTIGIGSSANDGTGDPLRDAFDKVNDNFDEVYSAFSFPGSNNAALANTITTGNTTVNAIVNSTIISLKNASGTSNVEAGVITVGISKANTTVVAVGANVIANATHLFVGNSTVNTHANSSVVKTGAANITSNTLTLGVSNASANGHTILPNGLLMQWGYVAANDTVGDITFSIPFVALYSITTEIKAATYHESYQTQLIASNTTTANVRTANTTAANITYMAIGTA